MTAKQPEGPPLEMSPGFARYTVDRSPEAYLAMAARRTELEALRAADLALMHAQAAADIVGPGARQDFQHWPKDMLVRAVLEDEGHLWHPGNGGPE